VGGWVGGLIRSQVCEGRGGAECTRKTHAFRFNLYHAIDGACRMQTKSTRQPSRCPIRPAPKVSYITLLCTRPSP
jgi:hypothetical protein